jgi:antitoxin HicB
MWYEVKLTPDDNGTFLATVPAFPEVTTFGESEFLALQHARDAIEEAIAARIHYNEEVPKFVKEPPRLKVKLPWWSFLKTALYIVCKDKGITRAELARRLDWNREQVERLFKLDHISKPDQLEAAYRAVGLDVTLVVPEVIEVVEVSG